MENDKIGVQLETAGAFPLDRKMYFSSVEEFDQYPEDLKFDGMMIVITSGAARGAYLFNKGSNELSPLVPPPQNQNQTHRLLFSKFTPFTLQPNQTSFVDVIDTIDSGTKNFNKSQLSVGKFLRLKVFARYIPIEFHEMFLPLRLEIGNAIIAGMNIENLALPINSEHAISIESIVGVRDLNVAGGIQNTNTILIGNELAFQDIDVNNLQGYVTGFYRRHVFTTSYSLIPNSGDFRLRTRFNSGNNSTVFFENVTLELIG